MRPDKIVLFDENIPHDLLVYFKQNEITANTVQFRGWSGYRNGELSQLVKDNNLILLTRDSDFQFLWKKYDIQVIYLQIHPPIVSKLQSAIERVFKSWNYNVNYPFIIIVQEDSLRLWKE